ncbi:putative molybdopterin-guanine dinucleotide biosynthesis protein A [Desulfamplus magnetovallimortis]|uniref:Probable molybdenum cofactor guanylyltransferase n=1 Tax=Desulfamplus magnetovallimortis TaxID=1246637 RepID=A0A1W1HJE7_9BACT|nr:molybdenum cofactor guanylyltransferase [Desulfamplus magnetovallimortis]SLM32584.1 putative molybdopterin-guanine dinucleotide biosynthesis protein A [Desulfamplus magnetovallimortis]
MHNIKSGIAKDTVCKNDRPNITDGDLCSVKCSAVIIAGGLNSRMGGKNKAFLKIGNKTIIERLLDTLYSIFDDIVLVTRKPELYEHYSVRIVTDIFDDRSSLTGIHSGLYHAENPFAFVAPCDAPFLQKAFIKMIIESISPENDVIIPHHDGYYEPLCAAYSKRCLPKIEAQLNSKNYRIFDFFDTVNVKEIGSEAIRSVDPDMLSFFNVNTPDTLARSIKVLEEKGYC